MMKCLIKPIDCTIQDAAAMVSKIKDDFSTMADGDIWLWDSANLLNDRLCYRISAYCRKTQITIYVRRVRAEGEDV